MNDYWNDPPDYPDHPSCPNDKPSCDGSGEYLYDGKTGMVFSCDICGYQWVIPFPIQDDGELIHEPEPPEHQPESRRCPHGKIENCDACDYLSDIAYDSAREQRYFGR